MRHVPLLTDLRASVFASDGRFLQHLPHLRTLLLELDSESTLDGDVLLADLQSCTHLTDLTLQAPPNLTSARLTLICLSHLPHLTRLQLDPDARRALDSLHYFSSSAALALASSLRARYLSIQIPGAKPRGYTGRALWHSYADCTCESSSWNRNARRHSRRDTERGLR